MELRFLEGNFEHGKFKLQYRQERSDLTFSEWVDVPCVKDIPEDSGIELIKRIRSCFGFSLGEAKRWYDAMRFQQEKLNTRL